MRKSLLPTVLALVTALASPAYAEMSGGEELPNPGKTSMGFQLFSDYVFPMGSFAPQAFEVKRARIYGNVKFGDNWSAAIVYNTKGLAADVGGKTTTLEAENSFLEMGYMQAQNLWPGSRVQFGQIITPWFEYESKAWGYRMLGLLPDAGGLSPDLHGPQIVPFYDFGASVQGDYNLSGVKLGYSLAVFNGEDQHHFETDGQKDYEGRISVAPLPDFELTLMAHKHNPKGESVGLLANREMVLGVWQHAGYKAAVEGNFDQEDTYSGNILGGWVIVPLMKVPLPTELVLRTDRITGDKTSLDPAKGDRIESVVGLSFMPANLVRIVVDDQNIFARPSGAAAFDENIIGVHTEVKY